MKLTLRTGAALGVLAAMSANSALAEGTPAGTSIINTATVEFEVGGVVQNQLTAFDELVVDRKINLLLTEVNSAATIVTPGQAKAVATFELTNLSNSGLDFALTASQLAGGASAHGGTDNFDIVNGPDIFVDANDNGVYDEGVDTAAFVDELESDQTVTIFVVGDIPGTVFGGDIASVELSATAHEGGASGLGTVVTNGAFGPNGSETVLADGSGASDLVEDGTFTARDDYRVDELPVDLEIEITTDNAAPLAGFDQYTITTTLRNTGDVNASGVVALVPVPDGNGLISDTSGGAWDPSTGEWTIGNVGIGETVSFTYTVSTSAIGTHDATAQIIATDQTDTDSDPAQGFGTDDLSDGIEDDDEDIAMISATRGTGTVAMRNCSIGTSEFDWTNRSWTPTALSGSFGLAGKPIDITVSDPDGALISTSPFFTPVNAAFYEGGLGAADEALTFAARGSDLEDDGITITLELGPDGIGVEDPRFTLFDIDGNADATRYEGITVTGSLNGVSVSPMLEGGAQISISGNQARGTADAPTAGATSADGTLQVGFSGRVDRVTISWGEAPGTTNTSGQPGFALHNFSICTPPSGIAVEKTSTSFDPANPFRIPGSDVIYSIAITNEGEVPIAPGTLFILDALPPEIEFFNGDHDGAGPSSDPVGFDQSGSGLTFDYAEDVRFSNGNSAPANFADCNYTPALGYDPAVTFVCINPKGQFEATDPDSEFTVTFRTRIK